MEIDESGAWTAVTPAPEDAGRYEIIASCLIDDQDPSDPEPVGCLGWSCGRCG